MKFGNKNRQTTVLMIYLFWISKSCQKNFQDLEKFKNMGKLPDSITLGKNVWWWEKVEERRQKSMESCQMHKNFQSKKNSFLMISWRLVRLRKKLTPKIFWLMMKFQFSVTTKFFVIESSSKILETIPSSKILETIPAKDLVSNAQKF